MSINWQDLRSLNGSQNTAFEELCCQLAGLETTPKGSRFTRLGAPDGGVECYWALPDESEWGWQAKFFLSTPQDTQWNKITDSVKTTLKKHPKLTRYFVCLPIDRQDPRIENQKWFMNKWDDHVKAWKALASAQGMSVEFDYWGASELWTRLSREENKGRYYFWFNRELFSESWFANHVRIAIDNAGERYTPDLDVSLPIAQMFDGLGRLKAYHIRVVSLLKRLAAPATVANTEDTYTSASRLDELTSQIRDLLTDAQHSVVEQCGWSQVGEIAAEARDITSTIIRHYRHHVEQLTAEQRSEKERINSLIYQYQELYGTLREIQNFALSDEAILADLPALLLVGAAGQGKTHLFCDVALHRANVSLPTTLFLGMHFSNAEPWSQMINLLGLNCTREEFLGALEASAQAHQTRAVIFIDGLNEGDGKRLWKNHIAGMLRVVSQSKWLAIALSVRSTYEDVIVPNGLVPSRLHQVTHWGFADHEYEASKIFFTAFGIQQPSVPLLAPEFQNPLFLKLFCKGLKNKGLHRVPPGVHGITQVFTFFLDSINEKLYDPEHLDYNRKHNPVQRVVHALAAKMAEVGKDWLLLEEAEAIGHGILPNTGYQNSLFRHLLAEGVLSEGRFRVRDERVDGVHFAYERFTDHLITQYLLDTHLDNDNPAAAFQAGGPLHKYVDYQYGGSKYQGIVEALAIQLPERIDKEIFELLPQIADGHSTVRAVLYSLVWRDPKHLPTSSIRTYINTVLTNDSRYVDDVLRVLVTIAVNPDHPLNADFLHKWLKRQELANRDALWSIFISDNFQSHSPVDRVIDWAWSEEDKSPYSRDSIRLCGVLLAWFLSTSNRRLRDRATKAMVRLFTDRTDLLREILPAFIDVNDPYVLERLMAVAYGCSMRTVDARASGELASDIYSLVFKGENPPVHILTRDYARGVIEMAAHNGTLGRDIDLSLVRPPYNSTFSDEVPSAEELKLKYNTFEGEKEEADYGQSAIWYSVMGQMGDFANYVIGADDPRLFPWSSNRIDASKVRLRRTWVSSLTPRQLKAFSRFILEARVAAAIPTLTPAKQIYWFGKQISEEESISLLQESRIRLNNALGKRKAALLTDDIVDAYTGITQRDDNNFDLSMARRWIFNRVFELGWTKDRFGTFDRRAGHGRMQEDAALERIGKKYQWIAYHEFLARVSDNFEFCDRDSREQDRVLEYDGPWQWLFSARDIDPSWMLPSTKGTNPWDIVTTAWWVPVRSNLNDKQSDADWVKNKSNVPDVESLIHVVNPDNNSHWLTLEGYYRWDSFDRSDDSYSKEGRIIECALHSYIVKQSDVKKVVNGIVSASDRDRLIDLLHSPHLTRVYFGECFWAPAFAYHDVPYHGRPGWTHLYATEKTHAPVLVSTDQYLQERSGNDYSIDDTIAVYMPCKWLADSMQLRWKGEEGKFYDASGNLVAFDPSVREPGPSAMLANFTSISAFLGNEGYTILWIAAGDARAFRRVDEQSSVRSAFFRIYSLQGSDVACEFERFEPSA